MMVLIIDLAKPEIAHMKIDQLVGWLIDQVNSVNLGYWGLWKPEG